jgi:hypothetical protein
MHPHIENRNRAHFLYERIEPSLVLAKISLEDIKCSLFSSVGARGDGRFKGHLGSKQAFTRMTSENRIEAIKAVVDLALREIDQARRQGHTYGNSQYHAFLMQQLANSYFSLREQGIA